MGSDTFKTATPEQRAEWTRKANETRARNKANGIPTVKTDAGSKRGRKPGRRTTREAPKLSRTDYRKYLRLGLIAIAGRDPISVFEVGKFVGIEDATKAPDFRSMTEADQTGIRQAQFLMQRVFDDMVTSARSWCPPEDRLTGDEADMIADVVSQQSGRVNQAIAPAVAQIKALVAPLLPAWRFISKEGRTIAVVAAIAIPRVARRLPVAQMRLRFGLQIVYGPIVWIAKGNAVRKVSQLLVQRRMTPNAGNDAGSGTERAAADPAEQGPTGSTRPHPRSEWVGEDDAIAAAGGDAA